MKNRLNHCLEFGEIPKICKQAKQAGTLVQKYDVSLACLICLHGQPLADLGNFAKLNCFCVGQICNFAEFPFYQANSQTNVRPKVASARVFSTKTIRLDVHLFNCFQWRIQGAPPSPMEPNFFIFHTFSTKSSTGWRPLPNREFWIRHWFSS